MPVRESIETTTVAEHSSFAGVKVLDVWSKLMRTLLAVIASLGFFVLRRIFVP